MSQRKVLRIIEAIPASDGAGVKLKRSLGQSGSVRLDPFLMLDEFVSDKPEDYLAGFPPHPHRGFETVTYMLAGHMLHEDHMGNSGHLRSGDVQWMTAGRGIIHSETPQQEAGLMHGFQLWINLPAAEKWRAAEYRDIAAAKIPRFQLDRGLEIRHIAGSALLPREGRTIRGYINGEDGLQLSTDPLYLDLRFADAQELELSFPAEHNGFIYVYEGSLSVAERSITAGQLAILDNKERLTVAGEAGARALLLAGRPIGEAVVQYGPFVMNSSAEIEQALQDYREGQLCQDSPDASLKTSAPS